MEYLEGRRRRAVVLNGTVFVSYKRMIEPFAPVKDSVELTDQEAKQLLVELGGVLVRWSSEFDQAGQASGWYAVLCDQLAPVDQMRSANTRSKLRRGLKRCSVRQLDADYLIKRGYETYRSAFDRYGDRPVEEPRYREDVLQTVPYPDLVHYWGVFYDNEIVGYSRNIVYAPVEVNYSEFKFNPAFFGQYSSYALMFRMTEHYLQAGFEYVNAGWRSIYHDTEIQDFLVQRFQFRRAQVNLSVRFRRPLGLLLRAGRPVRAAATRLDARLGALYELDAIARTADT
jgi:hypothetical protein